MGRFSIVARIASSIPNRRWPALPDADWPRLPLWVPVAMGGGILAYFGLRHEPSPAWLWLPWPILALALALRSRRPGLAALAGLAGAAALGFAAALWQARQAPPVPELPPRAVLLSGRVAAVDLLPGGRRVTLSEAVFGTAGPRGVVPGGGASGGASSGGIAPGGAVPGDAASGGGPSGVPPAGAALSGTSMSGAATSGAGAPAAGAGAEPPTAPLARDLRVRLRDGDPARPAPGDLVRVRALLRPPSPPAAPGGWDFQRAAFFENLAGSGFALGPAEILSRAPGDGAEAGAAGFAAIRAAIEARIAAILPGEAGAVSAALLTGSQSGIPAGAIAAMRDSGLSHLLSPSGLHVAVVFGIGFAAARWLIALVPALARRGDGKLAASLAGLALGGAYTLLTGSQVPMLRSFAMAALGTLALATGRRVLSLRALALAATLVLLWRPHALLGPSFQMSFAAVLALIAAWEAIRPAMTRPSDRPGRRLALAAAGLLGTSLIAGLATAPFGLHHFGRLQVYGVAANALAVPLTSVLVMPAGLLAVALMPLGLEGIALAPMGWGVEGVLAIARRVAAWPGAAPVVAPIPGAGLVLVALGMCWLSLWRARWRLLGVPAMLAGLASGGLVEPPDILVSGDARLIAVRTGSGLFLERERGGSAFTRELWLRGLGEDGAPELPRDGEAAGGAIRCGDGVCRIRPRPDGAVAALLRAAPAARGARPPPVQAGAACGEAAILISAEPIRGRCRGAAVLDRFSVWRDGPHAVWLGPDGVRVLSDREARGDRPWVPPPPRPRAEPGERPALTE